MLKGSLRLSMGEMLSHNVTFKNSKLIIEINKLKIIIRKEFIVGHNYNTSICTLILYKFI